MGFKSLFTFLTRVHWAWMLSSWNALLTQHSCTRSHMEDAQYNHSLSHWTASLVQINLTFRQWCRHFYKDIRFEKAKGLRLPSDVYGLNTVQDLYAWLAHSDIITAGVDRWSPRAYREKLIFSQFLKNMQQTQGSKSENQLSLRQRRISEDTRLKRLKTVSERAGILGMGKYFKLVDNHMLQITSLVMILHILVQLSNGDQQSSRVPVSFPQPFHRKMIVKAQTHLKSN